MAVPAIVVPRHAQIEMVQGSGHCFLAQNRNAMDYRYSRPFFCEYHIDARLVLVSQSVSQFLHRAKCTHVHAKTFKVVFEHQKNNLAGLAVRLAMLPSGEPIVTGTSHLAGLRGCVRGPETAQATVSPSSRRNPRCRQAKRARKLPPERRCQFQSRRVSRRVDHPCSKLMMSLSPMPLWKPCTAANGIRHGAISSTMVLLEQGCCEPTV